MRRKKYVTAVGSILLIAVYVMIFRFSADDAENSSAISVKVTKAVIHFYYRLTGQTGDGVPVLGAVDTMEGVIRKLAHFTEYMLVGFLSYGMLQMWLVKKRTGIVIVMIQLFLSGAADEIHQYFVPGRYASVKDVFIDTAGGIAGMTVILLIKEIKKMWKYLFFNKNCIMIKENTEND